ncbi:hypothetical protein ACM66B_002599 [Microbotryomycetes sp. NB124-2]
MEITCSLAYGFRSPTTAQDEHDQARANLHKSNQSVYEPPTHRVPHVQLSIERANRSSCIHVIDETTSLVNIIAQDARSPVTISSLTPSAGFTMSDGVVLPSPIIILDGAVFMWDVDGPTDGHMNWQGFNPDKLKIFETCMPRPEILLVGTGSRMLFPPPAFKQHLNSLGIQVDVQDSRNASSTFNLLAEEGRKVAAALYPISDLAARTGIRG